MKIIFSVFGYLYNWIKLKIYTKAQPYSTLSIHIDIWDLSIKHIQIKSLCADSFVHNESCTPPRKKCPSQVAKVLIYFSLALNWKQISKSFRHRSFSIKDTDSNNSKQICLNVPEIITSVINLTGKMEYQGRKTQSKKKVTYILKLRNLAID